MEKVKELLKRWYEKLEIEKQKVEIRQKFKEEFGLEPDEIKVFFNVFYWEGIARKTIAISELPETSKQKVLEISQVLGFEEPEAIELIVEKKYSMSLEPKEWDIDGSVFQKVERINENYVYVFTIRIYEPEQDC